MVGVQRKEINDLIASVHDGRLQRELMQMKALGLGVLVIEGRLQWASGGALLTNSSWTITQHRGLTWSVQSRGYWIATTESLADTCDWLSMFTKWTAKPRHSSLTNRPKPKSAWGFATDRDWGIHLLQSFTGIGPEVAARIYDNYGGVPLTWTTDAMELQQIPGIGATKAERLVSALDHTTSKPSPSDSQTA
jgi:ERCC4-type nuclease